MKEEFSVNAQNYRPGETLLVLLEELEGFRPMKYRCPAGVSTIGYGHTIQKLEPHLMTAAISRQQARELLESDCRAVGGGVLKLLKVPPTPNQLDAMVSFAFNVGLGSFGRSKLLKEFNAGHLGNASNEFLRWDRVGAKVLPGLVKRRQAEKALFLSPGV